MVNTEEVLAIAKYPASDLGAIDDYNAFHSSETRLIQHTHSFGVGAVSANSSCPTVYELEDEYPLPSHPVTSDAGASRYKTSPEHSFANPAKSKLLILNEKLMGFERQMERQAVQRRRMEEARFYNITSAIEKLQDKLSNETHARMETIKGLHGVFDTEIKNVERKLEESFAERLLKLENIIGGLEQRMQIIQDQVTANETAIHQNIETSCITIENNLAQVQKQFETEKLERHERELDICKRIAHLENRLQNELPPYITKVDNLYKCIKDEIEEIKSTRQTEQVQLRESIMDEINRIHNVLIAECEAREAADEDMVKALDHYGKILSSCLGIQVEAEPKVNVG